MADKSFDTPILFIIFNRLDTTRLVLDKIRKIKPSQLFIAADGPRINQPEDLVKCDAVREYVTENIDWKCSVHTLFRETNFGCGLAVSSAITWFFEQVPQGIILEDDVVPHPSFFTYCAELLERYRENDQILSISGSNLLKNESDSNSYFFSEYMGIWGWASWRRAWQNYEYSLKDWHLEETQEYFKTKYSKGQYQFFAVIFNSLKTVDTWDYQWWYQHLRKGKFAIIPSVNLTTNIGFGVNATHTADAPPELKHATSSELNFPLTHPVKAEINSGYELKLAKKYYWRENGLLNRIFKKIKNKLKLSL